MIKGQVIVSCFICFLSSQVYNKLNSVILIKSVLISQFIVLFAHRLCSITPPVPSCPIPAGGACCSVWICAMVPLYSYTGLRLHEYESLASWCALGHMVIYWHFLLKVGPIPHWSFQSAKRSLFKETCGSFVLYIFGHM